MNKLQEQIKEYIEVAYKYEEEFIKFVAKKYSVNAEEVHEIHLGESETKVVITNCHSNNIEFYISTEDFIQWCESPEEAKTDWSKVKVDTPILVHGSPRYFAGYDEDSNEVLFFYSGNSSRGNEQKPERHRCMAEYVTIDTAAPSLLNWIKNTGVKPDCKVVVAKYHDGAVCTNMRVNDIYWDIKNSSSDIYEYAIIK